MDDKKIERIKNLYNKTIKYQKSDPEISLSQSRKLAEAICKQIYVQEGLDKRGKPVNKLMLNDLIQSFNRNKTIPQYIIINLSTIQAFGNFGSHDQGEDSQFITEDNIIPCIQSLNTVVEWFFEDYHKIGKFPLSKTVQFTPSPKSENIKVNLGSIISKMCNRKRQENDFWMFFNTKCRECPDKPQFYFLHGEEYQGHDSFINRLIKTRLKEYIEKKNGVQYASITYKSVSWPVSGNIETRKRDLQMNLLHEFDPHYADTDYSISALLKLPYLNKCPLLIIKHNIYASKWEKHDESLLTWYLKEYWENINIFSDIPICLIFINIKYENYREKSWKEKVFKWKVKLKKRIENKLKEIFAKNENRCPCQIIEELTPVSIEDVKEWFNKYGIYEHEIERKNKIEYIFSNNDQYMSFKSMAEIEIELEKIVEECKRKEYI